MRPLYVIDYVARVHIGTYCNERNSRTIHEIFTTAQCSPPPQLLRNPGDTYILCNEHDLFNALGKSYKAILINCYYVII